MIKSESDEGLAMDEKNNYCDPIPHKKCINICTGTFALATYSWGRHTPKLAAFDPPASAADPSGQGPVAL